jgi:hypothetical protein
MPEKHYTLPRQVLIEAGIKKVEDERYFTTWAPRQTGKSTYFRLLAESLMEQDYYVIHVNVEGQKQLAYYINSLGLKEGIYLIFLKNTITNPNIIESVECFDDVKISTYLVRYDVETDFSAPKRKKK